MTTSGPAGVLVLLGDQPRVRREAIGALVAAAAHRSSDLLAVVPAYAQGGGANPALLLPPAWRLAAALDGDRGLGALLAAHHGRVLRVPLAGSNPDVDRPADLAALEGSPA